jgi:thioesterase-3
VESKLDLQDWMKKGFGFVVANININYRRPATLNVILEIQSSMASINQRSATIEQKIMIEGTDTLVADARVTFVIIDMKTNQVLPIKGELRDLLETF